jgi:CheY-like chemotaxis protein
MSHKSVNRYKLLIVDDEAEVISALRRQLRSWLTDNDLDLVVAESALEAQEAFQREGNGIAVMLCDNRMPGMTGAELIRILVKQRHPVVPILLTGYTARRDIQAALSSGVFSLIVKPWSRDKLLTELDAALTAFCGRTAGEDKAGTAEKEELRIARMMQDSVLSLPAVVRDGPVHIHYAQWSGGPLGVRHDFLDVFSLENGTFVVIVGDVAVSDLRGVAVAAFIRNDTRELFRNNPEGSPGSCLDHLSSRIFRLSGAPTDLFATAALAVIDPERGEVTIASAGSPFPLYLQDGVSTEIPFTGRAIGVHESTGCIDQTISLAVDEQLYLYTDGVNRTEALMKILETSQSEISLDRVLVELRRLQDFRPFVDDVTIVAISAVCQ